MLLRAPNLLPHFAPSLHSQHLSSHTHNSPFSSLHHYHHLKMTTHNRATTITNPDTDTDTEGPIEIRTPTLFATDDNPTPLQLATSVLLTGAITVYLFRSIRRRARRAKDLRVRSSGLTEAKKDVKAEALDSLRKMAASGPVVQSEAPTTPLQAFLAGIAAGAIALILYKFTTTIEAGLNRQTIPDNYSVRQITITVRTIINGVCYLATCVFGVNSVGLVLYSLQLAFNSIMESFPTSQQIDEQLSTKTSSSSSTSGMEPTSSDLQQVSDNDNNSTE